MFSILSNRSQPATLFDAEQATNDFKAFASLEVEERRLNPNLPKEVDPPSHRIMHDLKESQQHLERLKVAPQITTSTVNQSLWGSLWSSSSSAASENVYQKHTTTVKKKHDKAKLISKLRREHESIFTFALSGVLQTSNKASALRVSKLPMTNVSVDKEDIYQNAKKLHELSMTLKRMLDSNEDDWNKMAYVFTSEARAIIEKLAELFEETLDLFRMQYKSGQSFNQIIDCAERTIDKYYEIMLVDKRFETSLSVLEALRVGRSHEGQWKTDIEAFMKQSMSECRSSSDSSSSQDDPYEEEARRWNETMSEKERPQADARSISTSDFNYSLLNEKLPIILGLPEPNVPVLYTGQQTELTRVDDEEPFGSFATVKKYRLPGTKTFTIKIDGQEDERWDVDEIAVKHLDIPKGSSSVTQEAIRRNSIRIVREMRVWSRVKHENIVPLLGLWIGYKRFAKDEPSPCPVAPWMGGGNLEVYLNERRDLALPSRIEIMRGIISALSYMHNHKYAEIVHGDLKPDNILMKDDKVYLCDFGCSHLEDDIQGLSTVPHGNPAWLAPERIRMEIKDGKYTKPTCASDMYAFALVFSYTVDGITPFIHHQLTADKLRKKRMEEDLEPALVDHIPNEHRLLLKSCWSVGPLLRMPASVALEEVNRLQRLYGA